MNMKLSSFVGISRSGRIRDLGNLATSVNREGIMYGVKKVVCESFKSSRAACDNFDISIVGDSESITRSFLFSF